MKFFNAPSISVGTWRLPRSEVGVFDFEGVRTVEGVDIRGIIGWRSLSLCAVSLDFDHESFKILHDFALHSSKESIDLSVDDPEQLPRFKVSIQGRSMELAIDTGSIDGISLQHDIFVRMVSNGTIKLDKKPAEIQTAKGKTTQVYGHFRKGWLLGVNLKDIPVSDQEAISNIGLGFLLNFNVVIDLKGGKLFYEHRKALPPLDTRKMLGMSLLYPERGNSVHRLDANGAADRAGIKEHDHIVRLGPLQGPELNAISLYKLCIDHSGENLEVELQRNGKGKRIVTRFQLPQKMFEYAPREYKGRE